MWGDALVKTERHCQQQLFPSLDKGAAIPKQYLDIDGKPIASYSLETFAKMKEVFNLLQ